MTTNDTCPFVSCHAPLPHHATLVRYQLVDVEEVRTAVMAHDEEFGCKWKEFKDLDGRAYVPSVVCALPWFCFCVTIH